MAKRNVLERNVREAALGISKQIDINFRNYALYVLENRGIPSFYDALTNVQRVSLVNAPKSFSKTISLVGSCISNGYHHGDCLGGDTKIWLSDGNFIRIEDWYKKYPTARLALMSFDEEKNTVVNEIGHSPRIGQVISEIFEIVLDDETIVECTDNHRWFTQRGLVKASDLKDDDEILDLSQIYSKSYHHGTLLNLSETS